MIDLLVCGSVFVLGVVVGIIGSVIMMKRVLNILIRSMEADGGLWDG